MREERERYKRCLVLAGGGGRLGVHLGTVAAACEAGLAPDVLLGTCGGALVAALVHAEPDPARQLAWLGGPAMYRFWNGVRARPGLSLAKALAAFARRALDPRAAARVPDLDDDALFEVAEGWPALAWRDGAGIDAILLGARMTAASAGPGEPRDDRVLFEPVAIGNGRSAALLADAPAGHGALAVGRTLSTLGPTDLPLADAVRISLTDMIYLAPAAAAGARWLGGAVDLMPVELAARLADEVWIDRKDAISRWTIAPAWRTVLGLDARARQRAVDASPVALRIDHRGLARALPSVLTRRLALSAQGPRLDVHAATDAAGYRRVIEAQFAEGRRRAREAIAQAMMRA
ncbi:patatin-like phospholipase family protein [Scleromatobacter humisilvae]|uniref:Patatin-like phospholipase family protein n=1 Tax=Scleromatobacter humisilvae TaxID=2897159 RepID=A0A9X1YH77_9BURK|nr:patatin-like phospholipase family protein [Scleromatobacter humisilvae]MCK9686264.1 patatin-like phospholipase family protein [Scleromatobacter humisilvae]